MIVKAVMDLRVLPTHLEASAPEWSGDVQASSCRLVLRPMAILHAGEFVRLGMPLSSSLGGVAHTGLEVVEVDLCLPVPKPPEVVEVGAVRGIPWFEGL